MEKENIEKSESEKRIRALTFLYYSNQEVQKAIVTFCKNREVVPKYFEGFGKRPDLLEYESEVFSWAKKGATSLHCSEEIWKAPLEVKTGMSDEELNNLRAGWDLLIDIDSKYLDYSKILAELVIKYLNMHGVKGIGIKFSGSKGFHLIVPWKSFPKKINQVNVSDMFPEYPRILVKYLVAQTKNELVKKITELTTPNVYVKDFKASKEVIPDIIAVSPRHLFRAPYSLHEKTALAIVVLTREELKNFHPRDADPLKIQIKDFLPESEEGEASRLLLQALDWHKENNINEIEEKENQKQRSGSFTPIKLEKLSEEHFPPTIKKMLQGLADGKKRAAFILINFFRSIGMEREELEKRVYDWNSKNKPTLKTGYLKAQIEWSYRNKIVPPPNFDKDYYKGIGINPTEEELRLKNPSNYMVKKTLLSNSKTKENKKHSASKKYLKRTTY